MNKFVIILNLTHYEDECECDEDEECECDEDELFTDYTEIHTITINKSLEEFKALILSKWQNTDSGNIFVLGNILINKKALSENFKHIKIFTLEEWFKSNEVTHNEI